MRSRIEEEIPPLEDGNDGASNECVKNESPQKKKKLNKLANVKCLECHCTGTVMQTIDGIVLFPNKVKKTLLELGGGMFMPKLRKIKPVKTVQTANQKARKFVKGFNEAKETEDDGGSGGLLQSSLRKVDRFRERVAKGLDNARDEKRMELVKVMERLHRKKTKTPAREVPERFTGFFSDEFEKDNFWKSNKRFSLQ